MTSKEVTAKSDGVELKATFHTTNERVVVDFVVTNSGHANVYLTDVTLDPKTGGPKTDSLWVNYLPPDAAVLWSHLTPLDPTQSWAQPPSAYVTRVAPGETYKSTLAAPAPLRVHGVQPQAGPNGERDGWAGTVVECSRIQFDLGVISDSPELDAQAMTVAGKAMYRVGPAAFRHQRVVSVQTTDLSVPLITK